jgi:hypothetical protein
VSALIPHDLGNALFAGISIHRSSYAPVLSRARILPGLDNRGSAHFGPSRPRGAGALAVANPLFRAIPERPAECFLEERQVCGEAAGRHQLGELASLGPVKRNRRPPAQRPLER